MAAAYVQGSAQRRQRLVIRAGLRTPGFGPGPLYVQEARLLKLPNSEVDFDAVASRLSAMLGVLEVEFGLNRFEGAMAAMLVGASDVGLAEVKIMQKVLRDYAAIASAAERDAKKRGRETVSCAA